MLKIIALVAICLSLPLMAEEPKPQQAAKPPTSSSSTKKNHKPKVYIPKDLADAIATLKKDLDQDSLSRIKGFKTADEFSGVAHFSFGMGLRNSWGLWGGSRLAKWFNSHQIFHPDDMSGVILDALWCDLTDHPFSLEQKAAEYQAYWEGQKGPENTNCPTCGAKVEFFEMKGRKNSPTDHVSFQHGNCSKSAEHQWLWDRKGKWRKFTEEEWSKL